LPIFTLARSAGNTSAKAVLSWAHSIEVTDVFAGENAGLVIAEIELRHENETFDRPPWLGVEITGQSQYYNGSLSRLPFSHWSIARSAGAAG